MAQVPVVGVVSAGRGESYVEPLGHVEVPQEIVARYGDGLFALRVSGDSMFCEELPYAIPPGAYVVVAPHLAPQPGDVVVVWNEEHNVGYLKEYQPKEKGYQVLRSWNPEVPPSWFSRKIPSAFKGWWCTWASTPGKSNARR